MGQFGGITTAEVIIRRCWGAAVKDYRASIEKLRKEEAEAALIRDLATDPTKREMFDRLSEHLNRLAEEVEQAMKSSAAE